MKRLLIAAIALTALGGCATYDYAGGSGPGGYYRGSPTYRYTYPDGYWGGYYGGVPGYGYYGYGGGYGGYGGYGYGYAPYYYNRPYYVIRPAPRPPHDGRPGDGDHRPPPGGWPRPPMTGGNGRPQLPDRLRPQRPSNPSNPAGMSRPAMPPRAEGVERPMRSMPSRPSLPPRLTPRSRNEE